MLSLVLLPLGLYFAIFTFIFCRRRPTLFNGALDIAILMFGVFGLISLGPGKLLIPIYVYSTWEVWAILYWITLYYLLSYCICNACRNYIVIYNCEIEKLMNCISNVSERLDKRFHIEERTLHLPTFGIHCVIGGTYYDLIDKLRNKKNNNSNNNTELDEFNKNYSSYVFLKLIGSRVNSPAWELFQRELSEECSNLKTKRYKLPIVYGFFAGSILVYSLANIFTDFNTLQKIFTDYWM
ncbi:MAG: hypothetical protein LBE18_05410 [Planctomycetaceae bacterium]|jgi:hypothetical protein|nr:hypothetical protein [Planctomycetaceae bacterium]